MYCFGFNGKEMDNEVSGSGNQYDYGFRIYNPRLGKFLSVDPLAGDYPWYTSYQFAGNKPIWAIDIDGLEEYYITYRYAKDGSEQSITMTRVVDVKNNVRENNIIVNGDDLTKSKIFARHIYAGTGEEYRANEHRDEFTEKEIEVINTIDPISRNISEGNGGLVGMVGGDKFSDGSLLISRYNFPDKEPVVTTTRNSTSNSTSQNLSGVRFARGTTNISNPTGTNTIIQNLINSAPNATLTLDPVTQTSIENNMETTTSTVTTIQVQSTISIDGLTTGPQRAFYTNNLNGRITQIALRIAGNANWNGVPNNIQRGNLLYDQTGLGGPNLLRATITTTTTTTDVTTTTTKEIKPKKE